MNRFLNSFFSMLIFTISLTGCGTTLIKDQSYRDLSAVTMYIEVDRFVIEGVAIKNLANNRTYYNTRYGWGKEFFPTEKKYSYLSIGDIAAGKYSINKIIIWYFHPGEKQKKNIELNIPDDIFQFNIKPNDITYLGDLNFTILNPTLSEEILDNTINELKSKNYTVKKFKTMISYKNSESNMLYINGVCSGPDLSSNIYA